VEVSIARDFLVVDLNEDDVEVGKGGDWCGIIRERERCMMSMDGVFVSGTLEWWSIGCCLVVILLTWKQLRRDPTRIKSGLCGDGFGGISNNKPTPPSDR
jgi:hypothetical protein